MKPIDIKEIQAEIENVLVDEFAIKRLKITPNSLIRGELGIDGDDADDLIKFIEKGVGKKIVIDLSDYFHDEGIISLRRVSDISIRELSELISKS